MRRSLDWVPSEGQMGYHLWIILPAKVNKLNEESRGCSHCSAASNTQAVDRQDPQREGMAFTLEELIGNDPKEG